MRHTIMNPALRRHPTATAISSVLANKMASIACMLTAPCHCFRAVQRRADQCSQRNAFLLITEFYWTGEGIKPA